jgi:hypothetical protein
MAGRRRSRPAPASPSEGLTLQKLANRLADHGAPCHPSDAMTRWLRLRTCLLLLAVQAGLGAGALFAPAGGLAADERMVAEASEPMSNDCGGCVHHQDASDAICPLSCSAACPTLLRDATSEPHAVPVARSSVADLIGVGRTSHPDPEPPRPVAQS